MYYSADGSEEYYNSPAFTPFYSDSIIQMSSRRIPIKLQGRLKRSTPSRKPMSVLISAARSRGSVPRHVAMRANRHLRTEVKTIDTATGGMNFDANSAVASCMILLNTCATGAAPTQRIGKRIHMKSIAIRGTIAVSTATLLERIALLLIYIRTPNQAATLPAVNTILATQSATALSNRDNASKFKIIRRWDYVLSGNSTTPATGKENIHIDKFISLKNLTSSWTNASTNGTIGEFEEGALILLSVGNNNNGATTTPTGGFNTRVYFSDA